MTRIYHVFLCAVVIVLMVTAGCTSFSNTSPPPAGVTGTATSPAAPAPSTVPAGMILPGATGTQFPGTCAADTGSDAANCGGCGYACPANALCQQGACYCRDGFTVENSRCVVAAAGTQSSGSGCPAGMSPCPDGYCYELASSAANCGTCGNTCPAGMTCTASTCTNVPAETTTVVTTTPATTTTTTTVTTTSAGSPGLNGTLVRPGGYSLSCVPLGLTKCGSSCVNLSTSAGNCGTCGNICSGLTPDCCGGTCANYKSDVSNCGSCGHKCGIGSICDAGSCKVKASVTGVVKVTFTAIIPKITPVYQQPGLGIPGY